MKERRSARRGSPQKTQLERLESCYPREMTLSGVFLAAWVVVGGNATARAEPVNAPLVAPSGEFFQPFDRLRDRNWSESEERALRDAGLFGSGAAKSGNVLRNVVASDRDPVLTAPARELTLDELRAPETQTLIDDMIRTMHHAWGIGLAGPQVGRSLRLAIASIRGGPTVL